MAPKIWNLERAYAFSIRPRESAPVGYQLQLAGELGGAIENATSGAVTRPMTAVIFNMADDRTHPVRDLVMKVAFGKTRAPMAAAGLLAARLAECIDNRTGASLLITTIEFAVNDNKRRQLSMYVFPEETSYLLKPTDEVTRQAILEALQSFALQSRLRKVARFSGKEINTHFLQGGIIDMQIGSDPRTAADYWVVRFLDAKFAINSDQGTRMVAAGLRSAFEASKTSEERQKVMEAVTSLVADNRQSWSLEQIARKLVPRRLVEAFTGVAQNDDARTNTFLLDKNLLKDRINYRVFELEKGIWVSTPFQEVGTTVKLSGSGDAQRLSVEGKIKAEKVQRDKSRT